MPQSAYEFVAEESEIIFGKRLFFDWLDGYFLFSFLQFFLFLFFFPFSHTEVYETSLTLDETKQVSIFPIPRVDYDTSYEEAGLTSIILKGDNERDWTDLASPALSIHLLIPPPSVYPDPRDPISRSPPTTLSKKTEAQSLGKP